VGQGQGRRLRLRPEREALLHEIEGCASAFGTHLAERRLEKEAVMNRNVLQGKWREMKGKVKEQWGQLTDDDLDKIRGQSEQLLGLLQQRYGYARERAEEEYKRFIEKHSRELETSRADSGGH
jgi:uncharacterized protein YjbJ (UPF0337 family)